jgi:hypothetical protein
MVSGQVICRSDVRDGDCMCFALPVFESTTCPIGSLARDVSEARTHAAERLQMPDR